jgi:citrate synthase
VNDEKLMNKQIVRILGKAPTIAAANYRHRIGRPFNLPRNDVLTRALDVMFILHADHEMNCSTAAMRHIGSSRVDPYSAVAGSAAGKMNYRCLFFYFVCSIVWTFAWWCQ